MQFEVKKIADLNKVAIATLKTFPKNYVYVLKGEMGAGKTTLTKAFAKALKSMDEVTSPTFALINEYLAEDKKSIFHFDFYRIENETEAMDIGVSAYFYSGQYCFIEWAEKIPNLLPENYVVIEIEVSGEKRIIKVTESI